MHLVLRQRKLIFRLKQLAAADVHVCATDILLAEPSWNDLPLHVMGATTTSVHSWLQTVRLAQSVQKHLGPAKQTDVAVCISA